MRKPAPHPVVVVPFWPDPTGATPLGLCTLSPGVVGMVGSALSGAAEVAPGAVPLSGGSCIDGAEPVPRFTVVGFAPGWAEGARPGSAAALGMRPDPSVSPPLGLPGVVGATGGVPSGGTAVPPVPGAGPIAHSQDGACTPGEAAPGSAAAPWSAGEAGVTGVRGTCGVEAVPRPALGRDAAGWAAPPLAVVVPFGSPAPSAGGADWPRLP